jgi:aminoglycoside phosphotransferase (APT) family kinase protein
MDAADLNTAKRDLAAREGVKDSDIDKSIGSCEAATQKSHGAAAEEIAKWALTKRLDGVVWTSLETGVKGKRGTLPSIVEILDHLHKLPHAQGQLAEEYIRKAPPQIDTEYRRRVAKEFGWWPQG